MEKISEPEKDLFGVCPFVTTQKLLSGKWTLIILHYLSEKTMRFNELQRMLPQITQTTLTKQLRMMEEHGLIIRTVYQQIPPKVEYTLSDLGRNFSPVLRELELWGKQYIDYMQSKTTNPTAQE